MGIPPPHDLPARRAYLATELEATRREALRRQRAAAGPPPAPLAWAQRYRRIDDQAFTLTRHQPLVAIYDDDHPNIVIMKPAQVGVSELAVTRACHALDVGAAYWQTQKAGLNVAYLFPTATALRDFSKERFTGLMGESDHLAQLFAGGYDDTGFKQAGASYLYLRGAWTTEDGKSPALKSFPADLLIFDEYDEMAPRAIALADKRLRASVVKRRLAISTPTLPGYGIHAAYLASDQHEWEVQCTACDGWHTLDFFRDVRADGQPFDSWQHWERTRLRRAMFSVACPGCRAALDRLGPGRWVAQQPESDLRGYHVPALCFPTVDLAELALNATSDDPTQVEEFWRSDLGMPYQRDGTRITPALLDALAEATLPTGTPTGTVMGVDVGARFHYKITSSIGGRRVVRAIGAVADWDDLSKLMRQYGVLRCIVDAQPELNGALKWARAHPGRVLRAFYPNGMDGELVRVDTEAGVVKIHRTAAMDAVYARYKSAGELWPRALTQEPEVRAHLCAPSRVTVQDSKGQPRAEWVHTAPDHLYHASVYALIAEQLLPPAETGFFAGGGVKGWG